MLSLYALIRTRIFIACVCLCLTNVLFYHKQYKATRKISTTDFVISVKISETNNNNNNKNYRFYLHYHLINLYQSFCLLQ